MKKLKTVSGFFRISLVAFSLLLFCGSIVSAQPSSLIIRPKTSRALHLLSAHRGIRVGKIYKQTFRTQEAKDRFLATASKEDFDIEENKKFSADVMRSSNPPILAPAVIPGETYSGDEWSLYPISVATGYGGANIDAKRAWKYVNSASHVYIYVMDSGIDDRDPDLHGRVIAGYDALNPGQPPQDQNGHGTQVTSIIAASGENDYGMTGIIPAAVNIIDVRFLDANNQGDTSTAIDGMNFIKQDMQQRRDSDPEAKFVMNNSWSGTSGSDMTEQKMQELSEFDYFPVTSAGNNNSNNDSQGLFPCVAQIRANTCVGATDSFDAKASFSGYGPSTVHLFAPGVQIFGIIPGSLDSSGNYVSAYKRLDGTSQAVPHVTAVAALIWSINPQLSALDVHDILMRSTDPIPGGSGLVVSGGRLNALKAVQMAANASPQYGTGSGSGGGGCSLSLKTSDGEFSFAIFALGCAFLFLVLGLRYQRSCSIKSWSRPSRSRPSAKRLRCK